MVGIRPRDELEGMLAAQLWATHSAVMECFRWSMLKGQPFERWREQLNQANKLVRSFAVLLEALDRHRGAGRPQVVRVERVTVEAGGQAIVGAVAQRGGGRRERRNDPMHSRPRQPLPMHGSPRCGARTRAGSPCRSPAVRVGRRCRMHGGAAGSGPPAANRNALKHGRWTRKMVELRRLVRELLRGNAKLART
jgi:hypothetical protein